MKHFFLPGLAALALGLAFTSTSQTQERGLDWPRFRGHEGLGVSAAKGIPVTWSQKENLLWKKELPGPGTSSPIIVRGRIFLTCYTGFRPGKTGDMSKLKRHLLCLDPDGTIRWNKEVPSVLPDQDVIREEHGYASSTPVSDGERLYVFFGKSGVFAFSLDGEQLWHADVGSKLNGWGTAASPILLGDLVIVNASVESESLVALDKKSGKERWRARGIRESWNTPIVVKTADGKTEIAVAVANQVLGIDPADGGQLWSCATEHFWYMVPSMVAHDGVVYALGGRDGGGALAVKAGGRGDVTKTHRLWLVKKPSNVPSPILHEGHLYYATDARPFFYCLDAKTGKIVYEERHDRAGQIYSSPILVGNKLLYTNRQGATFIVPTGPTFQVEQTNDLRDGSTFNASPAVAGDRLFLRSDRFLYCIGKK
jgi:outer membrane protein assembly factor BamB